MSEEPAERYLIRDPEGNVYGPADPAMLRDWVRQGRIVRGMSITPLGTSEWVEAAEHPAVADMFPQPQKEADREMPAEPTAREAATTVSKEPPPAVPREATSNPQQVAVTRVQRDEPVTFPTQARTVSIEYESSRPGELRQNIPGTIGLIAGIAGTAASLPACLCGCLWPIAGLLSVSAIVLSSIGLWQVRTYPDRYATRSAPLAGLALGIVGLSLCAAWFALAILFGVVRHP